MPEGRAFARLNTLTGGHPLGGYDTNGVTITNKVVSIPSQAGILLAVPSEKRRRIETSGLNTLTGGHPLGGPTQDVKVVVDDGLNTLTGGHPLGGEPTIIQALEAKRLNTLTGGHPLGGPTKEDGMDALLRVSIPSQAGILLAATGSPN